jgi:hypothetical protein
MTDNNITQTHCCNHYPNRVLRKKDLAVELGGVCEKTIENLVRAGDLPEPCRLNSILVWMLYDIHAFLSARATTPGTGDVPAENVETPTRSKDKKATKGTAHKVGKHNV